MKRLDFSISVSLEPEEVVESIFDSVNQEDVCEFVSMIDLRYADVGVTEDIVYKLIHSLSSDAPNPNKFKEMAEQFKELCNKEFV